MRCIRTACSPQVAELRRLLVPARRLTGLRPDDRLINLEPQEQHYLRRVLRLRAGDALGLTDGEGRYWTARLVRPDAIALDSASDDPLDWEPSPTPLLGIATSLMRRGSAEWLRMCCELGIDRLQPLRSARCTPQADYRPERWQLILQEAVEQCERLRQPDLQPLVSPEAWTPNPIAQVAVAVTRLDTAPLLERWLDDAVDAAKPVWVVVGPEGGWTDTEREMFAARAWTGVRLGPTILRSSTAAVRAAVTLTSWRAACP